MTVESLEADIAPRLIGDGTVQSNDVVQIRSFLINCASIDTTTNEFQRADSAPYAGNGNGILASNDVVQVRRYVNNTDAPQSAGGPTAGCAGQAAAVGAAKASSNSSSKGSAQLEEVAAPENHRRHLTVQNISANAGSTVTVSILVDAVGDESEYAFVLNYQAPLSNPVDVTPVGTSGSFLRSCNVVTAGKVSCSVGGFSTDNPASSNNGIGENVAGDGKLFIQIQSTVAAGAMTGSTPITISAPPAQNASNDATQLLTIIALKKSKRAQPISSRRVANATALVSRLRS